MADVMKEIAKKYIPLEGSGVDDVTHLKITLVYDKGGYNVWTGKNDKRGYYLTIRPVKKEGFMESFIMFSGVKELVKEVGRQTKAAEKEALHSYEVFISNKDYANVIPHGYKEVK